MMARQQVGRGKGDVVGETERSYEKSAELFGSGFVVREVPTREFPSSGLTAVDALRLVAEDLEPAEPR